MFHAVTISEERGSEVLTTDTLCKTLEKLNAKPERSVFVGCDLSHEIAVANAARMITVRVKTGLNRRTSPRVSSEKPASEIDKLSDVLRILGP